MINRQNQLEQLIERKQLPDEVEQDVRAARGKIIVIVKNNLNTFDKLLLVRLSNILSLFIRSVFRMPLMSPNKLPT
jgi:hypothetical protein